MTAQLLFYGVCAAVWLFFITTTGQQRYRLFRAALWISLAIGALGFVAEVVMRGGALPITN